MAKSIILHDGEGRDAGDASIGNRIDRTKAAPRRGRSAKPAAPRQGDADDRLRRERRLTAGALCAATVVIDEDPPARDSVWATAPRRVPRRVPRTGTQWLAAPARGIAHVRRATDRGFEQSSAPLA